MQELLSRLPPDTSPEQLRSLLAPLFATDAAGQRRFYEVFDKSLEQARQVAPPDTSDDHYSAAAAPEENDADDTPARAESRWRRLVLLFTLLLAGAAGFVWDPGLGRWYVNPAVWFALAVLAGAVWAAWKLLKSWPLRVGYALAALGALAAGAFLKPAAVPALPAPQSRTQRFATSAGDTIQSSLLLPGDTATLQLAAPRELTETPLGGRFRVDSTGLGVYFAAPDARPGSADTLRALLVFAARTDTVYWIADYLEKEKEEPPPDPNRLEEIPLPYPHDIAELRVDAAAAARFAWYRRYEWPLKALLALLLGGLAWAIVRWDQYRRARAVAELRRSDRAPYVWKPETGADAAELMTDVAQPLLTRLRGRAPDDRFRLDARGTVRATSRNAGRATFAWRRRTLPPDYLLLIDRLAPNDHRAMLFDALYRAFLKAEAPVARYFYDGDPRRCVNEAHPDGIALAELLHRHAGAQLLLVGDGQGLIDPGSGRPAGWTSLLEAWPRRALLSPTPLTAWSSRERRLADLLPLLPASPGGLSAALDLFAAADPGLAPELLRNVRDAHADPVRFEHDLIEDLQRRFPLATVDWIAACALWPALHWDLTLYLGKVLGSTPPRPSPKGEEEASTAWISRKNKSGTEDVTVSSTSPSPLGEGRGGVSPGEGLGGVEPGWAELSQLTRLPWFTEGRIPEGARARLLDYLATRGLETPLREALRALLRQTPAPPDDSVAFDEYRMNVVLNELLLRPDAATRRRLERAFERFLAAGKKPDFVALRLLDRPVNRLDVLVGERLKKYAFREGLPGLGWRLAPKLAALWLGLAGALALFQPDLNPCPGQRVPFGDTELCLNDARDSLRYLEYLAGEAIERQEHVRVDSLRAAADRIIPRDSVFYRNTAARYYNRGVRFDHCAKGEAGDCGTLPTDSLQALACDHFQRAAALDSAEIHIRLGLARCTPTAGRPVAFFGADLTNCCVPCTVRFDNQSQNAVYFSWNFGDGNTAVGTNTTHTFTVPGKYYITLIAVSLDGAADTLVQAIEVCATDVASAEEQRDWSETQKTNSAEAYDKFLVRYPASPHAAEARRLLNERLDEEAWMLARLANTPEACRQYLAAFPRGKHAEDARACAGAPAEALPMPDMVLVKAGSFTMGCTGEQGEDCYSSEKPAHRVTLTKDFYLGRHEVTNAQYAAFLNEKGNREEGGAEWINLDGKYSDAVKCRVRRDAGGRYQAETGYENHPVIYVSWYGARAYCAWLSEKTGRRYRLPTEAEWEYAARGGHLAPAKQPKYAGSDNADEVAWYWENSGDKKMSGDWSEDKLKSNNCQPRPVGGKKPNALGLYDMSGNVYEWCSDYWGDYPSAAQSDPSGPSDGSARVLRGGSWNDNTRYVRVSNRSNYNPSSRNNDVGFRAAQDK